MSDLCCSFLKSFLVDFTIDQCNRLSIPTRRFTLNSFYDTRLGSFRSDETVELPTASTGNDPILLVPKRWLRYTPWICYDDYFKNYCPQDEISHEPEDLGRVEVLNYNRANYGMVEAYVKAKERSFEDCRNDPLFEQIPITSARRALKRIKSLPTGKDGAADRQYEDQIGRLLPSLFYPQLDFAQEQARTDDGVSIRDLIFYNTASTPLLRELLGEYGSRQITFEAKNVMKVDRTHVDQLNRYLSDGLGRFGVIVTRNPLKRAELTRTVNLWAGQRRTIITLTDSDVEQMVEVFDSKQRDPLDVVNKKYVEFRRLCP